MLSKLITAMSVVSVSASLAVACWTVVNQDGYIRGLEAGPCNLADCGGSYKHCMQGVECQWVFSGGIDSCTNGTVVTPGQEFVDGASNSGHNGCCMNGRPSGNLTGTCATGSVVLAGGQCSFWFW